MLLFPTFFYENVFGNMSIFTIDSFNKRLSLVKRYYE